MPVSEVCGRTGGAKLTGKNARLTSSIEFQVHRLPSMVCECVTVSVSSRLLRYWIPPLQSQHHYPGSKLSRRLSPLRRMKKNATPLIVLVDVRHLARTVVLEY